MKKITVSTLIAVGWLMSQIAGAHALTNGWNFIRVYNCYGFQISGVDYMVVYPTTGGSLSTSDPVAITAIAPLCTSGDGFFVYLIGNIWNGVSVYPSIR
jgi:hypothetical protein